MDNFLKSRFIVKSDPTTDDFIFKLPPVWWSRVYEYQWAKNFCREDDIALDAACGIAHPLKFYLLDHCAESHACDIDRRILSEDAIRQQIKESYGTDAIQNFPDRYLNEIKYKEASLTSLPYPDKYFDRIFCISVLEHLKDRFNRWPLLQYGRPLTNFVSRSIYYSLLEFKRVLKDDGLMILTFDFPRINLKYFRSLVDEIGLEFAGPVDFSLPDNALYSPEHKLYCFRSVLGKRSP